MIEEENDPTHEPILSPSGPIAVTEHRNLRGPKGNQGNQGDRGNQGIPGIPGKVLIIGRNTTSQILLGASIMLFVLSIILSQVFAWGEVSAVRHRLNEILQDRRNEQAQEDCLTLYRNDVSTALGDALAANNDLWVSVSQRGPALTDEEQISNAEDNRRLGEILQSRNLPLVHAVDALNEYTETDPPPFECPHPVAVAAREAAD